MSRVSDAAVRDVIDTLLKGCGSDGVSETVLIVDGERRFEGDRIDERHNVWSVTKSFVSTLAGKLIADRALDLDDTVAKFAPEVAELYPEATVRHFLTMTSGYQALGENRWGEDSADWSATPFQPAPPLFAPGSAFAYWDNAMNLFGLVLTRASGCDLLDLLRGLVHPLGVEVSDWWSEVEDGGIPVRFGGTGIEMSASELATFGEVILGGELMPDWFAQACVPQVSRELALGDTDRKTMDGRGVYGFNWWCQGTRPNGHMAMRDLPQRAFYASGLNHNVLCVVPEWSVVLVRSGQDGNPPDKAALLNAALAHLGPER